jgi:hypothetical protein
MTPQFCLLEVANMVALSSERHIKGTWLIIKIKSEVSKYDSQNVQKLWTSDKIYNVQIQANFRFKAKNVKNI